MRKSRTVFLLLLTVFCCQLMAILIVPRTDPNIQVHGSLDGLKIRELRKGLRALFGMPPCGNDVQTTIDCIARSTREIRKNQRGSWRRMAANAKIHSRRRDTGPILGKSLVRTKLSTKVLRLKQSLMKRRILRLLRLVKIPTLQYIYSRMAKVLPPEPGSEEEFDPLKCLRYGNIRNSSFADLDVPRNQRRLGRKLLNLLKRADDATFQRVCRNLYQRLHVNS